MTTSIDNVELINSLGVLWSDHVAEKERNIQKSNRFFFAIYLLVVFFLLLIKFIRLKRSSLNPLNVILLAFVGTTQQWHFEQNCFLVAKAFKFESFQKAKNFLLYKRTTENLIKIHKQLVTEESSKYSIQPTVCCEICLQIVDNGHVCFVSMFLSLLCVLLTCIFTSLHSSHKATLKAYFTLYVLKRKRESEYFSNIRFQLEKSLLRFTLFQQECNFIRYLGKIL